MFPMKDLSRRFHELLAEFDEDAERFDGDAEVLEEANAEFEDALFMLDGIDMNGGDWREEVADALEELEAMAGDYRKLAGRSESLASLVDRLDMAVQLARGSL